MQQALQIHTPKLGRSHMDSICQGGNDVGSHDAPGAVKDMLACAATKPTLRLMELFRRHLVNGVAIRATGNPAHAGIVEGDSP